MIGLCHKYSIIIGHGGYASASVPVFACLTKYNWTVFLFYMELQYTGLARVPYYSCNFAPALRTINYHRNVCSFGSIMDAVIEAMFDNPSPSCSKRFGYNCILVWQISSFEVRFRHSFFVLILCLQKSCLSAEYVIRINERAYCHSIKTDCLRNCCPISRRRGSGTCRSVERSYRVFAQVPVRGGGKKNKNNQKKP